MLIFSLIGIYLYIKNFTEKNKNVICKYYCYLKGCIKNKERKGKGEREGRGCERESGTEGGIRIKAEVANNIRRRMEGDKQGKELVGKNGYRVGKNRGVGREGVVGKKRKKWEKRNEAEEGKVANK